MSVPLRWTEGDRCVVRGVLGTVDSVCEQSACVRVGDRLIFCGVEELDLLPFASGLAPASALATTSVVESTTEIVKTADAFTYPEARRVERGEGWTMLLGDSLDVMMSVGPVDHVITDPPYEVEAHTKARRSLKDATQKRGAKNKGEVRRIDQPLEIDFAAITSEQRALHAQMWAFLARRWVLAFCQIEAVGEWRRVMVDAGLKWTRGCIWRKPDGAPQFTGDRPGQGFECMAVAHRRGRKKWNGGGKHGVWTHRLDHARGLSKQARAAHPTVKPIALMMELVKDFTDKGETILDPFAGSGSTGVAAIRLGRKFVGIERQERYFDLAVERLRAEENQSTAEAMRRGQIPLFGAA